MSIDIFLYIVSGLIIIVGAVGVFLPMLPGVSLMFVGILIAAFVSDFFFISQATIIFLGFLTIVSLVVDYFSGLIGAKYSGAGSWGSIGAVIGAVFGVSLLGPIGLILGPALGVLIFEFLSKKPVKSLAKSAGYTFFSTVTGMVFNFIIASVMIVIFVLSIFI